MEMVGMKKQGLESRRDLRITKAHEMYVTAIQCLVVVALASWGVGKHDHNDRSLALGFRKMKGYRKYSAEIFSQANVT